jgi:hypothetical protein
MPQVGSRSSRFRMVGIAALFWVVGIVSALTWQVSVRGGICSG